MSNTTELIKRAQKRAQDTNLPYCGALLPDEAYEVLTHTAQVVMVDVRTQAEWDWVGFVPEAVHIEWQSYPSGLRNDKFVEILRSRVPEQATILFLCRSGARSHAAAEEATRQGWSQCYNVLHGFEGDRDVQGHRGVINGWCAAGLPWKQN
ncbi:MAG: rhodanese-like domain-containing protein [Betaproteobacteria bacterium]|jgi:thiosulfate sulfurtransferase (EC 2.8.1.1)|nr:rhodanese-like domain-containing protein [Betaproteobacteria bacterium]